MFNPRVPVSVFHLAIFLMLLQRWSHCATHSNYDIHRGLSLNLVILVLDSKALSQVPEYLWTVLFEFELSWKILSEE